MKRFAAILLLLASAALPAQEVARAPQDSVIVRAKQLVEEGRASDGRKLLDSLIQATSPDSMRYAEALYWRAALATSAAEAERDYRRLLVEAPLSAAAEDALLQLAQLEQARGDRRGATEHLQRFMLSYANNPARPRAALALTRLLFEQGEPARACEALRVGIDEVPADNAELRNQLEFYSPRCTAAELPAPPAVDTQPEPPRDTKPSRASRSARSAATTRTSAPATFYSVQVAAYDSPEPAARMAQMLVGRGMQARVDGKERPFRVRVGRYKTRAEATKAAAALKAQGVGGFVAPVSQRP